MKTERPFLNGRLTERRDDSVGFDELVGGPVHVHLEMMDDGCLWGAFYDKKSDHEVVIWIRAKRGKLVVTIEEEP